MIRGILFLLCVGFISGCASVSKNGELKPQPVKIRDCEARVLELQSEVISQGQAINRRDETISGLQRELEEKQNTIRDLRKRLEMFGVFER